MCTAASFKNKYFGRTLDNAFGYGEEVVVAPRGYAGFGKYAIIGMAHVEEGYPLFYDAMNEKGLFMAGLNFTASAVYNKPRQGAENVAQFELIPRILSRCKNLAEAVENIKILNITDTPFSPKLPSAKLHWMIADGSGCVTVEAVKDGVKIYENTAGVLTNEPPFDMQMAYLTRFMHLSPKAPKNEFSSGIPLSPLSLGAGAVGLPGDLSSQSRFVRAAFAAANSVCKASEECCVSQFFHILGTVDQVRGCCRLADGKYETTIYTSCCSAETGIYYYTTYDNHQISAVDIHALPLDSPELFRYPLTAGERIHYRNR